VALPWCGDRWNGPRAAGPGVLAGTGARDWTGADAGAGDEVLPGGGRRRVWPAWWGRPGAALVVAVALLVGLLAGFAAGEWRAHPSAGRGSASTAASFAGSSAPASGVGSAASVEQPAVIQTPYQCFTRGGLLQLGVQVVNQSMSPVTLPRVCAVVPL
jgi:hypothetical protein